jgi:hypothetical protein
MQKRNSPSCKADSCVGFSAVSSVKQLRAIYLLRIVGVKNLPSFGPRCVRIIEPKSRSQTALNAATPSATTGSDLCAKTVELEIEQPARIVECVATDDRDDGAEAGISSRTLPIVEGTRRRDPAIGTAALLSGEARSLYVLS